MVACTPAGDVLPLLGRLKPETLRCGEISRGLVSVSARARPNGYATSSLSLSLSLDHKHDFHPHRSPGLLLHYGWVELIATRGIKGGQFTVLLLFLVVSSACPSWPLHRRQSAQLLDGLPGALTCISTST